MCWFMRKIATYIQQQIHDPTKQFEVAMVFDLHISSPYSDEPLSGIWSIGPCELQSCNEPIFTMMLIHFYDLWYNLSNYLKFLTWIKGVFARIPWLTHHVGWPRLWCSDIYQDIRSRNLAVEKNKWTWEPISQKNKVSSSPIAPFNLWWGAKWWIPKNPRLQWFTSIAGFPTHRVWKMAHVFYSYLL